MAKTIVVSHLMELHSSCFDVKFVGFEYKLQTHIFFMDLVLMLGTAPQDMYLGSDAFVCHAKK